MPDGSVQSTGDGLYWRVTVPAHDSHHGHAGNCARVTISRHRDGPRGRAHAPRMQCGQRDVYLRRSGQSTPPVTWPAWTTPPVAWLRDVRYPLRVCLSRRPLIVRVLLALVVVEVAFAVLGGPQAGDCCARGERMRRRRGRQVAEPRRQPAPPR
jgi:hypothetical protein